VTSAWGEDDDQIWGVRGSTPTPEPANARYGGNTPCIVIRLANATQEENSSWLEGTRIARDSQIRRLLLYHHDPDHDDALVDGLVAKARREFSNVEAAYEGMRLDL